MKIIDRTVARYKATIEWLREHWSHFDHFWRANERYGDVLGGRLAAAISYYAFFAAYSLGLLGFSILGYFLSAENVFLQQVNEYVEHNIQWLNVEAISSMRGTVTLIGAVALVFTGVGWVDTLRSAQRAVWHLDQHPGNPIVRRVVDLGMLALLAVLLGLSLAMTVVIETLLEILVAPEAGRYAGGLLSWSGRGLEFGVNVILAMALLAAVPRLGLSPKRLVPSALLLAIGIQVMNIVFRFYIGRIQDNPAYALVTSTVGSLVYLYLLNQMIVFSSAVAATSEKGTMRDLAAGPSAGPADGDRDLGADHLRRASAGLGWPDSADRRGGRDGGSGGARDGGPGGAREGGGGGRDGGPGGDRDGGRDVPSGRR